MVDLFETSAASEPGIEPMAAGAVLLWGAALPFEKKLLEALNDITARSPFRHMVTPGGYTMSVAMTNCGAAGWVTDRAGYRYDRIDPETVKAWPLMPGCFLELAVMAAAKADYPDFRPDACLINRYRPGARLSLHQDKNERDFANPIVSVSLSWRAGPAAGLPRERWAGSPQLDVPGCTLAVDGTKPRRRQPHPGQN